MPQPTMRMTIAKATPIRVITTGITAIVSRSIACCPAQIRALRSPSRPQDIAYAANRLSRDPILLFSQHSSPCDAGPRFPLMPLARTLSGHGDPQRPPRLQQRRGPARPGCAAPARLRGRDPALALPEQPAPRRSMRYLGAAERD